jgi:hypothetical protein
VYDFETNDWQHQLTSHVKPEPRFGHTQIKLTEQHLLIIGGSRQYPVVFKDIWLLDMNEEGSKGEWQWSSIEVLGKDLPSKAWCNASVRVRPVKLNYAAFVTWSNFILGWTTHYYFCQGSECDCAAYTKKEFQAGLQCLGAPSRGRAAQ